MYIRMLEDWEDLKKDQVAEVSEEDGRKYIGAKFAVESKENPTQARVKEYAVAFDKALNESADKVVARMAKANISDFSVGKDPRETSGGYRNLGEFAADTAKAKRGIVSEKLTGWRTFTNTRDMSEGIAADGGELVPQDFLANLKVVELESEIVHPRATIIPMRTNSIRLPIVNVSSHVNTLYGGVSANRTAEADIKSHAHQPTFSHVDLTLNKLTGLVYVSDELLEDNLVALSSVLNKMFVDSLIYQRDEDYLIGTGVGQSEGILISPALVVTPPEPVQTALLVAENIFQMYSRMYPTSINKAVWVVNNSVVPYLMALTLGGTNILPLWLSNMSVAGAPFGTILSRPLLISEKLPCVGQQGSILFADMNEYLVGEKSSGIQTASSIHLLFDTDQTAFRFVYRTDGKTHWRNPITPRNDCGDMSPFVVLGATGGSGTS